MVTSIDGSGAAVGVAVVGVAVGVATVGVDVVDAIVAATSSSVVA